jgi:hypothetical protein
MRRVGILLLAVIALIAMTGPVSAQPKVTITGFVDNVSSWSKNMSVADINPARSNDTEWYARTRVRPDITAEVGTTKFVLGLEIDAIWGQTANQDTSVCLNAACPAAVGTQQRSGATHGWDLNTDAQGVIELKWAYTEFNLPLIPMATTVRLGAQPWQATYKLATLANGDFAGIHLTSQLVPMAKLNMTYAFIEEASTGTKDNFIRGEDYAFIASVEITPFKGLDIRPIFSYANFDGVTNGAARQGRGGVGTGAGVFPTCPGTTGPGTGACAFPGGGGSISRSAHEERYTIGVDTRWRFGAFSLDPTIFYQFGKRDQVGTDGTYDSLERTAWFVDIRGGWQAGPLLLEGAAIYTTGNKARHRIDVNQDKLRFYEPISTDTSFYGGWAEVWALGIDYFNIVRSGAPGLNPGVAIGYDKYGLIRIGTRVSYALTPSFTIRAAANANWTAESVDTSSTLAAGTGLTPFCPVAAAVAGTCVDEGKSQYLGSEINLGFQWRFVPNVALDVVGSYMFAGNALATNLTTHPNTGVVQNGRDPQDTTAITARVRYSW